MRRLTCGVWVPSCSSVSLAWLLSQYVHVRVYHFGVLVCGVSYDYNSVVGLAPQAPNPHALRKRYEKEKLIPT